MSNSRRHIILYIALGIVIALPYVGFFCLHKWYTNKAEDIKNARFIIVDKSSLINKGVGEEFREIAEGTYKYDQII